MSPMDATHTTTHALPTGLGGIDAARASSRPGQTQSLSGNALLGLDVWGQTHAGERSLAQAIPASALGGSVDQVADFILAPLR